MARRPEIPTELTKRPFSYREARASGLTLSKLRGQAWRRLGSKLYCWSGLQEDPWLLLAAWRDLLPPEAVFVGSTAAWLLGLDMRAHDPIEIVVPPHSGIHSRDGLRVRRGQISETDIVSIRGLRATKLHRTLSDLCVWCPQVEALVAIDMAVALSLTDAAALSRHAEATTGRAGSPGLRLLAELAAPAESPMETRLRWLLIQSRLPRPQVQADLFDEQDRFVGRADLFYPAARLVIEYDGANHRERLVEDDRRQNLLTNAGFQLLRFTAVDIHRRPEVVVAQVQAALQRARLRPKVRNRPARSISAPTARAVSTSASAAG